MDAVNLIYQLFRRIYFMKNKTLVKVVAISALLVLVGLLSGCLMDLPPSNLEGKWGNAFITVFEFRKGEIFSVAGVKLYDAKYSFNEIVAYNTDGEKVGTAKYSISKNTLTIESSDIPLVAKGTYTRK